MLNLYIYTAIIKFKYKSKSLKIHFNELAGECMDFHPRGDLLQYFSVFFMPFPAIFFQGKHMQDI